MRTILSWAWFRPSTSAWDAGARWYRCDVIGGGDQSGSYVDLPATTQDLLTGRPKDAWLVCAQGATVDGSVKVPCSEKHDWRAVTTIVLGDDAAELSRRPSGPEPHQGLLLEVGRRLAGLPGRLRLRLLVVPASPSGTPATAARCAGRGRTREGRRSPLSPPPFCSRAARDRRARHPTPSPRRPLVLADHRHALGEADAGPTAPGRTPATAWRYDDALAPTISAKPVPCTDPHTAVNFYVGASGRTSPSTAPRCTG